MQHLAFLLAAARSGALAALIGGSNGWANDDLPAWVYKADGGVQCEREGVAVKEMEKELVRSGINVLCSAQAGFVVPAVCKGDSGGVNVYAIRSQDLPRAQALGFGVFPNDGRYGHQTPICTPVRRP